MSKNRLDDLFSSFGGEGPEGEKPSKESPQPSQQEVEQAEDRPLDLEEVFGQKAQGEDKTRPDPPLEASYLHELIGQDQEESKSTKDQALDYLSALKGTVDGLKKDPLEGLFLEEEEEVPEEEMVLFDQEAGEDYWRQQLEGQDLRDEQAEHLERAIKEVAYDYAEEDSEEEKAFDADYLASQYRMEKLQKRRALVSRFFSTFMALACLYVLFLIYGLLNTQYVYNDKGEVVPEIVSSSSLMEKRDFEQVARIYLSARESYQEVLLLDHQLASQSQDFMVVATDYNEVLGRIDKQLLDLSTIDVMPSYAPQKDASLSFLANDLAVYLQNVSGAITNNDPVKQDHAIQDKERCYQNFLHLTGNMIEIGQSINGFDVSEFANWSPEAYIESEVYGY